MAHPPSERKRTGVIRAPSGEVTATPRRGSGGVPPRAARVSDQNGKKSRGRVSGGRVARTEPEPGVDTVERPGLL